MLPALTVGPHAGSEGAALHLCWLEDGSCGSSASAALWLEMQMAEVAIGRGSAAGLWVAVAHGGRAGVHAVPDAGADHQRPQEPGAVRQGGPPGCVAALAPCFKRVTLP